ncbi:MAG: UDP-N-acetylmuramate dehydrogenase [Desulfobulbaceae bacterium]|nr:UDP-N-acetylmuramate dehydrogenase [Desulfobulbaceae bacterium]
MHGGMQFTRQYRQIMTPIGSSSDNLPHWAGVFNDEMADFWSGEVVWNGCMAEYTTLKVGGNADAIVFPMGRNELSLLIQGVRKINVTWIILGKGSNVLVPDEGIRGVVIVLGRNFAEIERIKSNNDSVSVRVEAGCSLASLVKWATKHGLSGLEFASGIPGTVGGAIVMNAGAWQREMKDVLSQVTIMDVRGCFRATKAKDMDFTYRSWGQGRGKVAVEGVFQLKKDDPGRVSERCKEYIRLRKERQPYKMASAGSFFKNPKDSEPAGKLIEDAGLKGLKVGGAMVSPIHANFIVNTGKATARDIIELMHVVQEKVQKKFGVGLEPEVKILGGA